MTSVLDKVIDWLSERNSHTAYGEDVLDALRDLGVDVALDVRSPANPVAVIRGPKGNGHIIGMSGREFVRQAARPTPKGPSIVDDEDKVKAERIMFGGWVLSGAIAQAFTGKRSESYGRGSAFMENLRLLKEEAE